MRIAVTVGLAIALSTVLSGHAEQPASLARQDMHVILLGTKGGPTFDAQRLGIGGSRAVGTARRAAAELHADS